MSPDETYLSFNQSLSRILMVNESQLVQFVHEITFIYDGYYIHKHTDLTIKDFT